MMTDNDLARPKRSASARAAIADLIAADGLRAGDLLPSERVLMQRLGTGRPAVREAMQDMERAGLIVIRHGGRARLSEPTFGRVADRLGETMHHVLSASAANLENLKDARATFEAEMARQAARKRSAQDIDRIDGIIAAQAAVQSDPVRFRAIDGHFHREIAAIGGNPVWPAVSDALFGWLSEFHAGLVAVPGLEPLTLAEHRGILDAIRAGDADRAGQAMTDHLNRANELYRRRPKEAVAGAG